MFQDILLFISLQSLRFYVTEFFDSSFIETLAQISFLIIGAEFIESYLISNSLKTFIAYLFEELSLDDLEGLLEHLFVNLLVFEIGFDIPDTKSLRIPECMNHPFRCLMENSFIIFLFPYFYDKFRKIKIYIHPSLEIFHTELIKWFRSRFRLSGFFIDILYMIHIVYPIGLFDFSESG